MGLHELRISAERLARVWLAMVTLPMLCPRRQGAVIESLVARARSVVLRSSMPALDALTARALLDDDDDDFGYSVR